MADWTPTMVEDRLESAADVFRSLPEVKPQGYFNAWPEYFHSFADQVGQEPRMRRPKPGPRDITQAEDTLLWLRWLGLDELALEELRKTVSRQIEEDPQLAGAVWSWSYLPLVVIATEVGYRYRGTGTDFWPVLSQEIGTEAEHPSSAQEILTRKELDWSCRMLLITRR